MLCAASVPISAELLEAKAAAMAVSAEDHAMEHAEICRHYYCSSVERVAAVATETYPLGMKSVDFTSDIAESNALIHVTKEALFTREEMNEVIETAEREGVSHLSDPTQQARSEYKYGQQVAIGKSIKSMPGVLRWFNEACRLKLFPQMAALFPQVRA